MSSRVWIRSTQTLHTMKTCSETWSKCKSSSVIGGWPWKVFIAPRIRQAKTPYYTQDYVNWRTHHVVTYVDTQHPNVGDDAVYNTDARLHYVRDVQHPGILEKKQEAVQRHCGCDLQIKQEAVQKCFGCDLQAKQEAVQRHCGCYLQAKQEAVQKCCGCDLQIKQEAVQRHCGCDVPPTSLVWRTWPLLGNLYMLNLENMTPPPWRTWRRWPPPPPGSHGHSCMCQPPCCVKPPKRDSFGKIPESPHRTRRPT